MRSVLMLAMALMVMAGGQAAANDSSAELATGGLVLTKNDAVQMKSEDLFISAREIKVRYRFRNTSSADVTTLVAFPMPDVTIAYPDEVISLPTEDPKNLLGFKTLVDGKPVATELEQKVLKDGVDRTDVLLKLKVPLAPHLYSTSQALDRLPKSAWQQLLDLKLAEIEEYSIGQGMEQHLSPRWTLKTTYSWKQTFPAGREIVIEHSYKPSVGATVQTGLGEPEAMAEDWFRDYGAKYCMDTDFLSAVARAKKKAGTEYGSPFSEERISYVLTTGANWAGPIGSFRLVVDKGAAGNLVSFCGEGVKKISPTKFEMVKTDFVPKHDLHVLILKRLASQ